MVQSKMKQIIVSFYKSTNEREPVREWLLSLSEADRKAIGEDIKTVEFGWPIGMPVCKKMEADLWEVRSYVKDGIARTFFTIIDDNMILLHGIIKKSQKTPTDDLKVARTRKKEVLSHE